MRWPSAIEWALGIGLVVAIAILAWNFDPFGRRKAAEQRAVTAEAQTKVEAAATQAVDALHTQTIIIREKSDAGVQAVQQAPGADQPVPPDVLAAWRAGLGELRQRSGGSDPASEQPPS